MNIWLHSIGYPPEQIGGTEVHVRDLAQGLVADGCQVHVSFIEQGCDETRISEEIENRGGVQLHTIRLPRLSASGDPGSDAAMLRGAFLGMIDRARADTVHFHPLYLDTVIDLIEAAAARCPVVVTYHTPTLTCPRGNLLVFGGDACDGKIRRRRCSACVFQQKGMPVMLAKTAALIPLWLCLPAHRIARLCGQRRLASFFEWPLRISALRKNMRRLWKATRHVVAVCEWVKNLILRNGARDEDVTVIRYGRAFAPSAPAFVPDRTVRFGFIGRLTVEKGVRVLLNAIEKVDDGNLAVEFCSPAFKASTPRTEEAILADEVRDREIKDHRVRVRGRVEPSEISGVMAEWDALIVPSLWMETGPQVVTEAFHAGIPVVGSRRGGIQELVKEGESGFLFPPGDSDALAALIRRFSSDPESLRGLRKTVPPGRKVSAMVKEIKAVYALCSKQSAENS